MKICETCGMKFIRDDYYQNHVSKHTAVAPPEPVVEVPVAPVAPPPEPIIEDIALKFKTPVEITINGVRYFGTEVKVKDIQVASEIVRIAREAYGRDILL